MSHDRFTKLYAESERALFGFVFSLTPDQNVAADIIQAAMIQIWEHFDEYDDSRPFLPWACQFAYRQVLMHRRRESTRRRYFSQATMELLSQDAPDNLHWEKERREALDSCFEHLSEQQQELISHRYWQDEPLTKLAERLGRSESAIYKALERTRKALADCIAKKLSTESRE